MRFGPLARAAVAATVFACPLFARSGSAQEFPSYGDHSFTGSDGGGNPRGALVQTLDRAFYGATYSGGANNTGTIFRFGADFRFVTLHSFGAFGAFNDNADGGRPSAALTDGEDGYLYGTTAEGGTHGDGTVFRITPGGRFNTIYSFNNAVLTGRNIVNPLLLASDGAFYGTAYAGGRVGDGTIFRITADGVFGTIFDFAAGTGANPLGALVEGSDGYLYGTTYDSAANNSGTVYKIARDGSGFAVLHVFGATGGNSINSDGSRPGAGLASGPDGALYGTTTIGGSGGYGTIFRLTTDGGSYSVLHNFQYRDGNGTQPQAALVPGRNGALYGTTYAGGANGRGTVFRVTPDGQFGTLASLDGTYTGDTAVSNVILSRDGQLVGMTQAGGASNRGAIFEVDLVPPFFAGAAQLSKGIDYLNFTPNGNIFGYYAFLSDPHYIYHLDLGYEYVFDAADGDDGVYFYDFASSTFFYTSQTFAFPYLYDFSLQALLYYYPDPTNPQRYNTNGVRYFYNFATRQIISK